MPALRLKNLRQELSEQKLDNDNIHRIAITNSRDPERSLQAWWRKKYRIPPKDLDDYTAEELLLEYLEDYYRRHPEEADKFQDSATRRLEDGWDGKPDPEMEKLVIERLKKNKVFDPAIIEKYRTPGDENLSDDEIKEIFDSLGRDLPGSKTKTVLDNGDELEEFSDVF